MSSSARTVAAGTERRADATWWPRLGDLLARGDGAIVRGARRDEFLERWRDIQRKEDQLDDRLFLGLVGGTGVGKSTLINALAGDVISRSGDRRPTTDRAVVYRHAEEELPQTFPRVDLATPERTHEVEPLRRLVLLDFPDFDSVEADHAAILERALPHLDVTFVLVDETKYGDQRLYDVLRSFPQSPENLYFVLNKVDEISWRYGASWEGVVQDIARDFRAKVAKHVGWDLDPNAVLAISALGALRERCPAVTAQEAPEAPEDANGPEEASASGAGEFERLVGVLDEYRAAKRRLAAKRVNLKHLKRTFAADLSRTFVASQPSDLHDRARTQLEKGLRGVESVFAGISQEVLRPRERAAMRAEAVRRLRPRLGFPMDMLFTLFAEFRFRRGSREAKTVAQDLLAERLRLHYQPARESLAVFERRYRAEVGEAIAGPQRSAPLDGGSGESDARRDLAEAGEVHLLLAGEVDRRVESLLRWRKLRNHLLPAAVVALYLWSLIQPVVATFVEGLRGEASVLDLLGDAFSSVVSALNPVTLIGVIVLVLLLYAIGAVVLWSRLTHAVEDSVTLVEETARRRVRDEIDSVRERLEGATRRWKEEYDELERLVERAGIAAGTPRAD